MADGHRLCPLKMGVARHRGLRVSLSAVESSLDSIQVHGGYGYMTEAGIERRLRDAVGGRIYSGTSEMQRAIVGRSIGL